MRTIVKLTPEQWKGMSEHAHFAVFKELRTRESDRIDYVLLGTDDEDIPLGYITVRELEDDAVYWQFGGALPPIKGSIHSFGLYQDMLRWTFDKYERITTLIENDNAAYLKMAAKVGFKIIGCRTFKGKVLLEHLLEKETKSWVL